MRQGLRLWQSAGTPMNCKLTSEKAHSGKFSVLFWDTNRATVLESISAEAKQVFKLSVWLNHNEGGAEYEVVAIPRSSKRMLSRSTIPVPRKPGEWQQVEFTFTAPPETKTLGLYVFAHRQSPGAKIWIDDFFIGRYPETAKE